MRARLAAQDGMAMPIVMAALAVLSGLATLVLTGSVRLSDSSNVDRDSKRALSVAEAGLRAATFRVNKMGPANANCLTAVATPPVGGECPGLTEDMGNGASYSYWVTPILTTADRCAGLPLQGETNGQIVIVQRCVTAVGTVNGVRRRVQSRVAAYQGAPIFPLGGILGVDGVRVTNTATVNGAVGSNGLVQVGNSSSVDAIEIAQGAPTPIFGGQPAAEGTYVRRTAAQGDWVLAPVDVGDSATENDNARITQGLDASRNVTFDPETRDLVMGNNSTLTLGGGATGTYNFCRLVMGNGAQINIAAGATVRIFIDSPDRTPDESDCKPFSGAGSVTIGQNSFFNNPSGRAENLQIYVYGLNDGSSVVNFQNSSFIAGAIYAPQSLVTFKNSATVVGAIAAGQVEFKNGVNFTWSESLGELRGRTVTVYYRSAWRECRPQATVPSDPESGC